MEKFCISVDWLQTFCLGDVLKADTYYNGDNYLFFVKDMNTETAQFKRLFGVYLENTKVAVVQQCPRTSVINPKATLVKLENRILYSQKYIEILYALQKALGLYYKGITRIDLCYDCNCLKEGRSVERFIKQYITSEAGEIGHIVRKGSARFAAYGTKKQTSASKFNSISWGSPKSKIRCYCYDKTLELIEVKDKPWIRKYWKDNGLECDVDFNNLQKEPANVQNKKLEEVGFGDYVKKHVWRFEISIGSEGRDILNMSTGELFRLSIEYLKNQQAIEKLFYIYAEKCFFFKINTGQKLLRNYPRLQIFEMSEEITSKPVTINKFMDSGRSEKICYNKLKKLSEEYSDLASYQRTAIIGAMEFLAELSGKKSSILRLTRYTHYLDELKGYKFLNEMDKMYFGAMERMRLAGNDYDAETLWQCFNREEHNEYWDKLNKDPNIVLPEDAFF